MGPKLTETTRTVALALTNLRMMHEYTRAGFGFGITESTGATTQYREPGTFLSVLSVLSVLKIGDF